MKAAAVPPAAAPPAPPALPAAPAGAAPGTAEALPATETETPAAAAAASSGPSAPAAAEEAAPAGRKSATKAAPESAPADAAEPAAKSKPTAKKRDRSRAGRKAAAEQSGAGGSAAKTAAKAASPAAAKPAARSRTRSTAAPDSKANGKAPAAKGRSSQRSRKRRLQYRVGQQLVYPLQGVGQVRNIEERPFRDRTLLYYVVYLEVSDMTIMVPVDRADELGIRAIVPRAEARSALALIGEDYEPIPTDWKLRYQMNLDLLKAGAVSDIATVVRALYHRSRIKELPILERKLYDNARSLLVDELSFSLGKDKAKIEELINSRLEVGVK